MSEYQTTTVDVKFMVLRAPRHIITIEACKYQYTALGTQFYTEEIGHQDGIMIAGGLTHEGGQRQEF